MNSLSHEVVAYPRDFLKVFVVAVIRVSLVVLVSHGAWAADNLQVDSVSVIGLTSNATTQIEVRGKGFDESLKLILPVANQQKLKLHSPTQAEIEVQLGNVQPQIVWSAFRSSGQVAGERRLAIDSLPNQTFAPDNASLPIALTGRLNGNQIARTTVELKEGEYFFADVQARRLGANFQPLLRVLDDKNRQVASSGPVLYIEGDASCWFKVAKTGKYTIALQDLEFMPLDGTFRLRMASTSNEKQITSRSVSGQKRSIDASSIFAHWAFPDNISRAPLDFALKGNLDLSESALPRSLQTNWMQYEASELVVEDIPNVGKVLRVPSFPAVVRGTLQGAVKARFIVTCGSGKPVDAEVWATRLGANFDPRLTINAIDNRQLAVGDDRPGTIDPRARFGGDPNVNDVLVSVESVIPIQGNREPYELVLSPAGAEPIDVSFATTAVVLRPGGLGLIKVNVARNGMNSPIELVAVTMSDEGVLMPLSSGVIPENQNLGLVPIQVANAGASSLWLSVIAKYSSGETTRVTQVVVPGRNLATPGVAEQMLPLIVGQSNFEAQVTWKEGTTEPLEFVAGLDYEIPVQWAWPALTEEQKSWQLRGEVISTQTLPRTNPQDGNSPIDYRKAMQVGSLSPDGKTIAILPVGNENAPQGAGYGQVPLGQENMLRIVVPADAVEGSFHWSMRWTALDANGNVQGPVWDLKPLQGRIVSPLKMKLEKEVANPWNWNKDVEQNVLPIVVESLPGVSGTAQIVWQGFPQGIATTPVDVEISEGAKNVSVKLPDLNQQAPGTKLEGLKLVLQWKPNRDGNKATYVSPLINLPALNFP